MSDLIKQSPDPAVSGWIEAIDEYSIFLSVVSLAEIRRGVEMMPPGRRRARILDWFESDLIPRFEVRILSVDRLVADAWGAMMARGHARGRVQDPLDGFIAATAEVHGLTVVTRNVRDFADTGVPVLDPWNTPPPD